MNQHFRLRTQLRAIAAAACVTPTLVLLFFALGQIGEALSWSDLKAMLMAAVLIALPVSLIATLTGVIALAWVYQRVGWFRAVPISLTGAVMGAGVFYWFVDYMAASFGGPGGSEPERLLMIILAGAVAGGLSAWVYWRVVSRAAVGDALQ